MVTFKATIQIRGVNPYVSVSQDLAGQIQAGWKRSLPVLARVNGHPQTWWRINLMPVGDGSFYLYLHEAVRQASGTKVGDEVEVTIRFDERYQNGPLHPMPDYFRVALNSDPVALANWDALSPSRKKEILRYFAGLKSEEAKQRNLFRAMQALSGQSVRFMGRLWENGQ